MEDGADGLTGVEDGVLRDVGDDGVAALGADAFVGGVGGGEDTHERGLTAAIGSG